MDECCAILLFASRKFASSKRCMQELFQSDSRDFTIIPVLVDESLDLEEIPSLNFVLRSVKSLKMMKTQNLVSRIVNRFRLEGVPCPDEKVLDQTELEQQNPPRGLSVVRSFFFVSLTYLEYQHSKHQYRYVRMMMRTIPILNLVRITVKTCCPICSVILP